MGTGRQWFIGVGILCLVTAPAGARDESEGSDPVAGKFCELHVWGSGRPNFKPRSNMFVKVAPDPNPTDPLSDTQLYSTVNRTQKLGDVNLRRLFPDAETVTIVRHSEIIDTDKTPIKRIRTRLDSSQADCYGDLVLTTVYGVFPNPDFQGLLVDAIAGGNRLVVEFWMQRFDGINAKQQVFKRRNDAPLLSFRAPRQDYAASIAIASDEILVSFADTVEKKLAAKTKKAS